MPVGTGRLLSLRNLSGALCVALVTFVGTIMVAAPAVAGAHNAAPEYSMSIVEGADTQPGDSIEHVSGSVNSKAEVVLSLTHDGLVVDQQSGEGGVWLSQVPQVGDVVKLESPAGVPRGVVVYDGLPSLEPSVCAGSTNFSGQRSSGYTVEGGYYTVVPHPEYFARRRGGLAQVQVLSGSSFGGSFLAPLASGETVYGVESLTSPIEGGASFTYSSEYDRPVGGCPPPPPPPPPPAPRLALAGAFAKLTPITIVKLLRSGWATHLTINQPGKVVEDLYQHEGTLPAFAASNKHKHKSRKPPAVLLARGTTTVTAPGTVSVTLHLTANGRRLLKHARSVKVVLIATLTATSGAKLTLEHHSLTLHR
jgi:hypothetical protein